MHAWVFRGTIALVLTATTTAAIAQSTDHSEHAASMPMDQSGQTVDHADHMAANDDVAGAEAVLTAYRNALTARDADAMMALFTDESFVFENGKDEGSFANYMENHLGPELDGITSFVFGKPTVAISRVGHMAFGRETYSYQIELTDGRMIEREGVATSVLTHDADGWKIVQYHSSSRAPRSE